jgi:hydrogenase expression/formation protein HypC
MCLGLPGKILKLNGDNAVVSLAGARVEVSMCLLDGAGVGDYVIVHAGFAIEKFDTEAARKTLELMDAEVDSACKGN